MAVTLSQRKGLSRRGFVVGGLGAGIAALSGCSAAAMRAISDTSATSPPIQSLGAPTAPTTVAPSEAVTIERVFSPARNTTVELVTVRPQGITGTLQVCL